MLIELPVGGFMTIKVQRSMYCKKLDTKYEGWDFRLRSSQRSSGGSSMLLGRRIEYERIIVLNVEWDVSS